MLTSLTYTCRELDDISFHKLSDATLDELAEFFEDLGDSGLCSSDYDVSLAVSFKHNEVLALMCLFVTEWSFNCQFRRYVMKS